MDNKTVERIDLPGGYYIKNNAIMKSDPDGDYGILHFVRHQTSSLRKQVRNEFAQAMNGTTYTGPERRVWKKGDPISTSIPDMEVE